MSVVRKIRDKSGVTQAQLARAAGTSQPAIAAYESGAKMPSLRTLHKLADSVGLDLVIDVVPALSREDRRSLSLHQRIAEKVRSDPAPTLEKARRNLRRMAELHPQAASLFGEWEIILEQPPEFIARVITDPSPRYRELRQVTPFAGVLNTQERSEVYRQFQRDEARQ